MSMGCLHEHKRRASRCAVIMMTDDAMLNGATPMFLQAVERRRRIVGVQRGQHEVAGLGCLDGNLGGFEVADFTHHDDVGILAQKGLEREGEGEACLVVDVDLVDAGQVDFRGVFGGLIC
jgi:hypothetical protein